jgi:hypothetical protein
MRTGPFVLLALFTAACAPPPARSPLQERLAASDTPRIDEATRTCLTNQGWRVDPVGDLIAGANVVTAAKRSDQTQVFIQAPDVKPRITGGPDDGDPFWGCLAKELESPKSASSDSDDKPSKDDTPPKDKPSTDKPEK